MVDAATERTTVALLRRLGDEGRIVAAVHHDLSTVEDCFAAVVVLAHTVIAAGPIGRTVTEEDLRRTRGGRSAFPGGANAPTMLAAD